MKVTKDTAVKIIEHYFKKGPKHIGELEGGLENHIFEVEIDNEKFIVRISEAALKLQYFLKEQWAVERAKEMKVPTAEILEVGNEAAAFPYMIVRKVEGIKADVYPDRMKVVREMGRYAAVINSIPTNYYGHVFDWSNNTLSRKETWKEFMDKELEAWKHFDTFEKYRILSQENLKKLKKGIRELEKREDRPHLCHSDLRLKNIILDERGKIKAILDWENSVSNIAPHWELANALHDLTLDEKEMFLEGYGLNERDYLKLLPDMKVINMVNYGRFIIIAHENKDRVWLERLRLRLNADLDLFSL
jgi:Ser/Thr protein kinase RdoA (MazF antagonist)